MKEILNCPFCGGKGILKQKGNNFTKSRKSIIECENCHSLTTVGAIRNSLEWTIEEVIKKWNTRFTR